MAFKVQEVALGVRYRWLKNGSLIGVPSTHSRADKSRSRGLLRIQSLTLQCTGAMTSVWFIHRRLHSHEVIHRFRHQPRRPQWLGRLLNRCVRGHLRVRSAGNSGRSVICHASRTVAGYRVCNRFDAPPDGSPSAASAQPPTVFCTASANRGRKWRWYCGASSDGDFLVLHHFLATEIAEIRSRKLIGRAMGESTERP